MEEFLHAIEVKQDVTDDCFVNLWFVRDWDGDDGPELFVINREAELDGETIIRFLETYQTEYCGQDRSCGDSIEKVEYGEGTIRFIFNKTGQRYLKMDSLVVDHDLPPTKLDEIKDLLSRILTP